jgi:hypothetical protein
LELTHISNQQRELVKDSIIKSAARLGELFGQNPLDLLDRDDVDWLLLMACAKVISNDREEQERKSKTQQA